MNDGQPNTVMVVEPDAQLREELLQAIRRAGFAAISCADGEQALQVLQRRAVEAVVMELLLPGMRGEILARQAHTTSPDIVVLVQSTCDQLEPIVDVFRAGARDFLKKPVSPDELVFRLKRLLLQRALAREDRWLNMHDESSEGENGSRGSLNLRVALRAFEKRHILQVLEDCEFEKHAAAAALGIGLSSLYRKMDELSIGHRAPGDRLTEQTASLSHGH